jgi:hypothetical protein
LPNEPKVVQCLPGKLKKQRRAKGPKTAQKPFKTDLKEPENDSNEAKTTPVLPKMIYFTGHLETNSNPKSCPLNPT